MARVVLYTRPGCPQCDAAREEMARGVKFEERDVSTNPDWLAEAEGYGAGALPVIVTAGLGVQIGFPEGDFSAP